MIIPTDHHDGRSIITTATSSSSSELVSRAIHEISGAAKSASPRISHLMARYLALRADDDGEMTEEECHPKPNIDLCEKQASAGHLDIIVPVCIVGVLLAGLLATLVYFHLKRKRRDEAEWSSKNNHEMEDYGIETHPSRR